MQLKRHLALYGLPLGMLLWGSAALGSHPELPLNLKQEEACATPPCPAITPGAFVATTGVRLTASSSLNTCESSSPTYKLEFELRPLGTPFTGTPTNSSAPMAKPNCVLQEYPWTTISGLAPGQYHWQVREYVYSAGTWAQFNSGTLAFIAGNPTQPDLQVIDVNLANMVSGATTLSFDLSSTFKNWGLNPANNFFWRAYLSTDKLQDAADTLIYTSSAAFSVGANTSAVDNGNVSISPKPAPGQYYVLVEADHTNAVAEFSETNNLGSTINYFTSGVDLVATSVSGPATSGPESSISLNVRYFNQGSDAAGTMQYKVYLSANTSVDGSDFVLHTDSKNMTGGQTVNETLTVTVPRTVPGGDFYFLLEVDSGKTVAEAIETNNVVASAAKVKMQQAELEPVSVQLLDPATGSPTQVGYFGHNARLAVTIKNSGGADAKDFKVQVVISADSFLSLSADTPAHDEPVSLVQSGQTYVATINFLLPDKDRFNKSYTTGPYYLFALIDRYNEVGELDENNNNMPIGGPGAPPVTLRTPSQDYRVGLVRAPASAAVGDATLVYRELKNIGNVAGDPVSYRFFASANNIITEQDIPLGIVSAGGTVSESGTVTLGIGAEDNRTELVRLPPFMPPGLYYFGVLVDVGDAVAELDETNNAGYAATAAKVEPGAFQMVNPRLPDAIADRPYAFQLAASGAAPPFVWSLDPSQGSLPDGLTLAADGTLSGTPTAAGVSAFTAVVKSGDRMAAARLALRVLTTTTELRITTQKLPPVVSSLGTPYGASLGAVGGTMPYVWRISSGALPSGLSLSAEGVISGTLRTGVPLGESRLNFEVADSLGARTRAELKLKVVEPGALFIKASAIPNGAVFVDYLTDLSAQYPDGRPLAKPLSWSVASGTVPPGLMLTTESDERGILSGKPQVAGTYAFSIQVEDAKGKADVADFVMRVHPNRFRLSAAGLPAMISPGQEVSFAISTGMPLLTQYFLYAGALPPGLALAENGTVSGTVASDKSVGVYNFVVESRDIAGSGGLGAFTVEVVPAPRTGCQAVGGGGAMAFLGATLLLCFRRRRAR